jgi:hypothetical protein
MGANAIKKVIGQRFFEDIEEKAIVPVCVAEHIQNVYYLFEKDTDNFMCQAPTLEELPQKLFEAKNINLALVLFPHDVSHDCLWIVNGKIKKLEIK